MKGIRKGSQRWLPSIAVSLAILAIAPFMGRLQELLRGVLGGSFQNLFLGALVTAALGVTIAALSKMTRAGGLRWLALALVPALLVVQIRFFGRGDLRTDLAEKVHVLEYGGLALLVFLATRDRRDLRIVAWPLLWVAAVGILDEWVQFLAPTRVGEWVDVTLNLFGGLCGWLLAFAVFGCSPWRRADGRTVRHLLWSLAVLVLLFAGFFDRAHLGYRIRDPKIGSFLSWHTREALLAASAEREIRWAREKPGRLPLLGIEDTFRTEAASHVSHRNAAWERKEYRVAWKENLLLETYYGPFLRFRERHRLPGAQRAELERRGTRPSGPYPSPVLAGRIYSRPSKTIFWVATAGFLSLLVGLAESAARRG